MKDQARRLMASAIVLAEIVSLGGVALSFATPASAQEATQGRRKIKSQQQLILQQQRQILENQRQIQAQQAQIARSGAAAAAPDLNRGLLGNIGNCPAGYRFTLFEGCLPAVLVVN